MTNEETIQVQAYIQNLHAQHTAALQAQQAHHAVDLQKQTNARTFAQADSLKMGQAVHEIWKLSAPGSQLTPEQLGMYVRQIINHYCPDFDIPF